MFNLNSALPHYEDQLGDEKNEEVVVNVCNKYI